MISHRPLRIAFVADTLRSGTGGGILSGAYVVDRLRRDHDVVTVGADGDEALRSFQFPLRAMRESNFVMARPDREVLAKALAGRDVAHLQFPFWLSLAALDEARKLGVPVVAAFHVQPENALYNIGVHSTWLNDVVYRRLVKRFYNRVDAVLCPTRFAEDKLRAHGLTVPTFVISNGVPPDAALALSQRRPPDARSGDGKFHILAVGRLAAEKRQDLIIEAVNRSQHRDQIHLVLSGSGPREEELKRLAEGLPGGADIGYLSREDLLAAFAKADLFVHASEVELEGMAVLEAMSAGLPALIADAPQSAASSFALDPRWSFPAGDADALAARIDALIDDRAMLEAAREPYRARSREFDFEASVERVVDMYRQVIAQHASAAILAQSA